MKQNVRLGPELFGALHLSALANNGIGPFVLFDLYDAPCCILGHALWINGADSKGGIRDNALFQRTLDTGFDAAMADDALIHHGAKNTSHRIPFEEWCEVVGVDVAP